jgi:hypothetical protein
MGQGPRRRDNNSDEYEDRHKGVDTSDAQQEVDEAIRRVQERFGEVDVDAEDVGRVAGGAAGGFGGGAAGGLAGSAVGGAVGREAGGRTGRRYAAAQANSGPSSVTDVQGIGEGKAETLRDAGYESIEDIQDATRDELEDVDGIGPGASGRLKDAVSQADTDTDEDTDTRSVDPTVRESIEQMPFDSDEPTPTQQAKQEIQRATSEAKHLYNTIATTFASRTRNQEVAQAMADQIEEGIFRKGINPSYLPTSVGPNDTGNLVLSDRVGEDSVNHELGHAVVDAYGYGREWAAVQAENEYGRRIQRGENDPFIPNDPNDGDFLLSQENGVQVDDVPEEMETLVDEINHSWQRIQRRYQSGGLKEAEKYTIRNNYSSSSASEVFGQLNEVMQSDDPQIDRENAKNNRGLIEAYCQVFMPSEIVRGFLDDLDQSGGEGQ